MGKNTVMFLYKPCKLLISQSQLLVSNVELMGHTEIVTYLFLRRDIDVNDGKNHLDIKFQTSYTICAAPVLLPSFPTHCLQYVLIT